jgi:hypothetical protein
MYDEIKRFLGDEAVMVPMPIVDKSSMAEDSKEFLTSVGLPTRDDLPFPFFKRPQDFYLWCFDGRQYLVLAEERDQKLSLDLATGEIFIIDARRELPKRFVNSNVKSLIMFLKYYSETKDRAQKRSQKTVDRIISQLRRTLSHEDPAALGDDESWWSVILEQTEQGLM